VQVNLHAPEKPKYALKVLTHYKIIVLSGYRLSSFDMVNCHLLRRWTTRTSAGSTMTRANGEVVSQPSPAPSPTNDRNTVWPSALQTTLQELVSSVPAGLVPTVIELSAVTKRVEVSSVRQTMLSAIVLHAYPANSCQPSKSSGIISAPCRHH
jgi:hypothetical protein